MSLLDEYEEHRDYACTRCGQNIPGVTMAKRKQRGSAVADLCADCVAKPVVRVGKCIAWSGEVDIDTLEPLKNGKPYLPGWRSCGHKDCVNRRHIHNYAQLNQQVREAFQATGQLLTFEQVIQ